MQLEIHAHGFELTEALRAYARARLGFALNRLRHGVRHVVVRLSDLNGPRGGRDKRCQVQIGVADAPELIVKDTDADLYAAIDRAAERAGRSLARRIGRQHSAQRPRRKGHDAPAEDAVHHPETPSHF